MLTETELVEKPKSEKVFNVLYVDDEVINLRLFKMAFKRDYNVLTAETGDEAIETLRQNDVQLIITDQKMPSMTGTQLLENTIDEFPDIIRIILTGYADIEAIVQAVNKCKIYKYITKPYDQSDLKLTLNKALELFTVRQEKQNLLEELAMINRDLEKKVKERTAALEIANKRLTDGLIYAQSIQEYMLPKEEELTEAFGEVFTIYRPKDFVGGDFFWFKRVSNGDRQIRVLAAVDCMGHGVAGALLSMIGETQLNQIVSDNNVPSAGEILDKLDHHLREALARSESDGHSATMDASLVIVDETASKLEFAGAKLDLVYYLDDVQHRLKGTRKSIGSTWNEGRDFESHTLELEGITELYLFSDGFQDQFDSENTRKFGSKQLLQLINSTRGNGMKEQKQSISSSLDNWQQNTEQVDDITLIGIQL